MFLIPMREWIEEVFSLLNCNATSDFRECFMTFDISEDDVFANFELFKIWYDKGLTPVEALKRFEENY